ncbi:MAG: hypothetical protein P8X74_13715 [Reinekea sp.]
MLILAMMAICWKKIWMKNVLSAKTYACPICEVPIDQALAEGCKLSHKIPNFDDCKKHLEQNREELAEHK